MREFLYIYRLLFLRIDVNYRRYHIQNNNTNVFSNSSEKPFNFIAHPMLITFNGEEEVLTLSSDCTGLYKWHENTAS